MLAAIFGFDQYVYNADRLPENPNLLFDRVDNGVFMVDHTQVMWYSSQTVEDADDVVIIAENHIYCAVMAASIGGPFCSGVKNLSNGVSYRYVESVPRSWFTDEFNEAFLKNPVKKRRDNIAAILVGTHISM